MKLADSAIFHLFGSILAWPHSRGAWYNWHFFKIVIAIKYNKIKVNFINYLTKVNKKNFKLLNMKIKIIRAFIKGFKSLPEASIACIQEKSVPGICLLILHWLTPNIYKMPVVSWRIGDNSNLLKKIDIFS